MPIKEKFRNLFRIDDKSRFRKFFSIVWTFTLIAYGWMLFYAPDMRFVTGVTRGYFHLGTPYIHQTTVFFFAIGFVLLLAKDIKDEFFFDKLIAFKIRYPRTTRALNYIKYTFLSILIVWIGVLGGGQFIYFKF